MDTIKFKSYRLLRNQIYDFFRDQIQKDIIKPGDPIAIKHVAELFGVSRTPLREALLQLQSEGFVTILPQRGVFINKLGEKDIKNIYEILGGLESRVVISVFDKIGTAEIAKMRRIDMEMQDAILYQNSNKYYDLNVSFHAVILDLSKNETLVNYAKIQKQKLYGFTSVNYGKQWENKNFQEHEEFIQLLEKGNAVKAADYIRDVHWIFKPSEGKL
jgi:DNA-binding GntR family transcriptional regulator